MLSFKKADKSNVHFLLGKLLLPFFKRAKNQYILFLWEINDSHVIYIFQYLDISSLILIAVTGSVF